MRFPTSVLIAALVLSHAAVAQRHIPNAGYRDWKVYGGGPESMRYSTLDQINRENVQKLQVAWTFDTGDVFEGSEMQCNPIIVHGVLYATTSKLRVIALDAASGKALWHFQCGSSVYSSPMSFAVDGKQYVAIAAGSALFTFGLP